MPHFMVRTMYKGQSRAYVVFDQENDEAAKQHWTANYMRWHDAADPEQIRSADLITNTILAVL